MRFRIIGICFARKTKASSGDSRNSTLCEEGRERTLNGADVAKQNTELGQITPEDVGRFLFTVEAERLIAQMPRPELWLFPHPIIKVPYEPRQRRRRTVPVVTVSSTGVAPVLEVPTPLYVFTSDKCAPCLFELDANTRRGFYVGPSSWPPKRVLVGGVYMLTSQIGV